jgi:hypothetical protein
VEAKDEVLSLSSPIANHYTAVEAGWLVVCLSKSEKQAAHWEMMVERGYLIALPNLLVAAMLLL